MPKICGAIVLLTALGAWCDAAEPVTNSTPRHRQDDGAQDDADLAIVKLDANVRRLAAENWELAQRLGGLRRDLTDLKHEGSARSAEVCRIVGDALTALKALDRNVTEQGAKAQTLRAEMDSIRRQLAELMTKEAAREEASKAARARAAQRKAVYERIIESQRLLEREIGTRNLNKES
jgi:hypothetical protein